MLKKKQAGTSTGIARAKLLFARKKYGQVISLLTPQVVLYRKEHEYHELMGLSCLHTGDIGGAYSYLKRAYELDPKSLSTLLALALVQARRRNINEALTIWLSVLEIDIDNARAQRALELAKTFSDEDWINYLEEGQYTSVLAPHESQVLRRIILPLFSASAASLVVLASIFFAVQYIPSSPPYRANAEILVFEASEYTAGDYSQFTHIVYTEAELSQRLAEMQALYRQYRDNLVRFYGNQILVSNAPLEIKDRVSYITGQLQEPDFTNFQDNFLFADVSADSMLYNGVFVRWRGRVANLEVNDEVLAFDFLVGFETGRVLQGSVPVQADFAVNLVGGEALEIIAQVIAPDGSLRLKAQNIRRIE